MTAKKIPELKFKYCNVCLSELIWDEEKGAHVCTNDACRSEVWFDPMDETSDDKQIKAEFAGQYVCRSQVNNKVKGGSKSGKKYGGKDRMKKPTTHQIYENLCNK